MNKEKGISFHVSNQRPYPGSYHNEDTTYEDTYHLTSFPTDLWFFELDTVGQ